MARIKHGTEQAKKDAIEASKTAVAGGSSVTGDIFRTIGMSKGLAKHAHRGTQLRPTTRLTGDNHISSLSGKGTKVADKIPRPAGKSGDPLPAKNMEVKRAIKQARKVLGEIEKKIKSK